jgi:hypothetical protein
MGVTPRSTDAMDPIRILRESIRITLRSGPLWILVVLLCLVMIPAFLLSGGFGAATLYLMMPGMGFDSPDALLPLRSLSAGAWAVYILLTLILLILFSLLSWAVQAAMIRGADAAADGRPLSVAGALRLGRQRWVSLAKLAVTFGLVIQAIGILPPLLTLAAGEGSSWGAALAQMSQSVLMPLSIVLGIAVFLMTMSIALEDVRPRMAFGRVWRLLRAGWWGFLLAYVLQGILALAVALAFGVVLGVAVLVLLLGTLMDSTAEIVLAAAICLIASPLGILALIFILVFSTVFFTLTYRAAAAAAAAADGPHPGG